MTATKSRGRPRKGLEKLIDRRVLDGATEVFTDRGYAGATMSAVASAAGVSKHTLYARYADKQSLFLAVASALARRPAQADDGAPSAAAPEQALAQRLSAILRSTMEPDLWALYRLHLMEWKQVSELHALWRTATRSALAGDLEQWLARVLPSDGRSPHAYGAAVDLLLTMTFQILTTACLSQGPLPSVADIDRHAATVARLFLGGARQSAAINDNCDG